MLLSACGRQESAMEVDGRGVFTTALLETLEQAMSERVSYEELMWRMPDLSGYVLHFNAFVGFDSHSHECRQNPQCEGVRVHSATESGGFSPDFQPQILVPAGRTEPSSYSDAVTPDGTVILHVEYHPMPCSTQNLRLEGLKLASNIRRRTCEGDRFAYFPYFLWTKK